MYTKNMVMNICTVLHLCTFSVYLLKLPKNYKEYHICNLFRKENETKVNMCYQHKKF